MADTTGAFVPNKNPKTKTDNPVLAKMPEAAESDATKRKAVRSITGNPLTGAKLATFKATWDKSALLQKTHNPDGTKKAE